MVSKLKDYTPAVVDVIVPAAIKEKFPNVLFEGKEKDEIFNILSEKMVATFPTKAEVLRKLDEYEVTQIREEYCLITEDELPCKELNLAETLEKIKMMKKAAEEEVEACRKRIAELAQRVKAGTETYKLPSTGVIQFCLNGYKLQYAFVNGHLMLVGGRELSNKRELWSQEDKNRKAFNELFGTKFPEVEKPEDVPMSIEEAFDEALEEAYELDDKPTR